MTLDEYIAREIRLTKEQSNPNVISLRFVELHDATAPLPDIVRAACAVIHADCTFQTFPWRRAYRLAELGMASGIFVLQKLPERGR